jgi:hypothetical protein
VVHSSVGIHPPISFSSLLASSNLISCTEPQRQLRIGHEIYMHLNRSSFLELGPSIEPIHSLWTKNYKSLALISASLNIQYAQNIHNYFHLALWLTYLAQIPLRSQKLDHYLNLLPTYLYIKKGS